MDQTQKRLFCSILLTLVFISLLVGVNFVKIYSNYTKNISAQTAKLNFKINRGSTQDVKNLSFTSSSDKANFYEKLAPGFEGKIELELDSSESEADIDYFIKISENGSKPQNMYFQANIDGKTGDTYLSLKELANKELNGKILKSDFDKTRNITIYAIWPYETGTDADSIFAEDLKDTDDGKRANAEQGQSNIYDYGFSLKVVSKAKTTNKKIISNLKTL